MEHDADCHIGEWTEAIAAEAAAESALRDVAFWRARALELVRSPDTAKRQAPRIEEICTSSDEVVLG